MAFKKYFSINKTLLPLKVTLFFFAASYMSILPYLTLHMVDIGITYEHISYIYAVLPFAIFLAIPFVGFLADKIGSFTRVLYLTLLGSGVFHTVLVFLPLVTEVVLQPEMSNVTFEDNSTIFQWSECQGSDLCPTWNEVNRLEMEGCEIQCPIKLSVCEAVTNMSMCHTNGTDVAFNIGNITKISSGKTI